MKCVWVNGLCSGVVLNLCPLSMPYLDGFLNIIRHPRMGLALGLPIESPIPFPLHKAAGWCVGGRVSHIVADAFTCIMYVQMRLYMCKSNKTPNIYIYICIYTCNSTRKWYVIVNVIIYIYIVIYVIIYVISCYDHIYIYMITYTYIDIVLYIVSYIITYYVHTYIYIYRSIFIHSLINRSCRCVVSRIRVGPRGNPVALGQGVECPQKGIKKNSRNQPKSARDVTLSAWFFSNEPTQRKNRSTGLDHLANRETRSFRQALQTAESQFNYRLVTMFQVYQVICVGQHLMIPETWRSLFFLPGNQPERRAKDNPSDSATWGSTPWSSFPTMDMRPGCGHTFKLIIVSADMGYKWVI